MPQFDVLTFFVQLSYATVFIYTLYLFYARYVLTQIFYAIRFRQKLLLLDSKLRLSLKSTLIFTEICKSKII